ncbi:hypothetical protein [Burkholderia sp. RF2-non_BP3]|uniref:hypothetical protein n=1 Tax=Burkholderia sp. RF2-non_BP3 TaxID=1637844 RepID=UPI0007583E14|nr:hypothetical protein [Burkholderia sp. RF2-non_BP3]KUY54616.1 hypothetical protein WS45_19500 [Burkholderia sp. RF2-non_BP3]
MEINIRSSADSALTGTGAVRHDTPRAAVSGRIRSRDATSHDMTSDARVTIRVAAERRDRITTHRQINEQASGMQQVLDYLAGFSSHLNALKQAIGSSLVGGGSEDAARTQLARTVSAWHRRAGATGGRLSDALDIGGEGKARRAFTVEGLNAQDARRAAGEVITFHLAGTGASPATAYLAPDLSTRQMVYQLKVALVTLRVACDEDPHGRIRFSVEESRWPSVMSGLRVKGGGVRFPDGEPLRPTLTDVPERIDPAGWRVDDPLTLRATLRAVVQTQERVEQATTRAEQMLRAARRTLELIPAVADADWARAVSGQMATRIGSVRDYEDAMALAPATAGVERTRVHTLLALR